MTPTPLLYDADNAARLLRRRGWRVLEVVGVHPDAILYLGADRRPMTAWLRGRDAFWESGFPAWPSPGVIPAEEEKAGSLVYITRPESQG